MKADNIDQDIENHIADILKIFPNQLVLSPKQLAILRNTSTLTLSRERLKGIGIPYIDKNGKPTYPVRAIATWLNGTIQTA